MDLRVVKTHKALTESLKSLLLEKPLPEITVNELCERAMVRRATFYKHFGDKYELLTFTLREMQGEVRERRDDSRSSSGGDGVFYRDIAGMLDYIEENEALFRALNDNCSTAAVSQLVIDILTRDVGRYLEQFGSADSSCSVSRDLMCQLLAGSLYYGISWWLNNKDRFTSREMARQLNAYVVNVFGNGRHTLQS